MTGAERRRLTAVGRLGPRAGDGFFACGRDGGCAALRHGNASPLRRYDSRPTSLQSPLNFVFAFRRKLRSLPCISSSQCARSAGPHREPCMAVNRAASSKRARFIRHWRRFAHFPHFLFPQEKKTGRARSKRKVLLCPTLSHRGKVGRTGVERVSAPDIL